VIGRLVSHFYVIRSLGSGGMGVVYEAQDTRLPRSVAIKFLKPSLSRNVDAVRRFKREARLASLLNHPNICTVLDVGECDGQSFIAMELLQGRSLKTMLGSGLPSLDHIIDIGCQVADGLGTAHDQGIVHRDITPGNIFVTNNGVVKLLDFGLARHFATLDADGQTTDELTLPGAVAGTIQYMAPEQLVENGMLDYRCDLFSLGIVLYQMATGARPFEGRSRHDFMTMIREQPHVPMRQLAPHHPAQLESIIDKLLAKRPDERYQTVWALRAELDSLKHGGVRASKMTAEAGASVAVLPFAIIGQPTPEGEDFRDGLAEDLSSRLSAIPNLRVAPRTSVRPLIAESVRTIGEHLAVEMVLEGSVQQADHRMRVIANLIDASSERFVVPAITVERRLDDTLTMQGDIANEIVNGLSRSFADTPGRRYTQDPAAYHALKRGQHHWKSCFAGGWQRAIEAFQEAVDRDPRFALAHAALAHAYNFLGFYCLMKPSVAFGVAGQSAERALAIDETLATGHVELALVKFGGEWDWEGAEREFRRALALEPGNAAAHVHYSWLLMLLGRDGVALAEAQAGHELAPSSRLVAAGRAQTLYLSGRYDAAIDLCNQCLRFDPEYVFATHLRGLCYLVKEKYDEALTDLEAAVRLTGRAPFYLGLLGLGYGQCGRREDALCIVPELNRQALERYVPPQSYVFIYAGLGKPGQALEYQEKAYEDGASPLNYLTPPVRWLYALDPQHKKRLEQMRLRV
jgi:serine/threonine-protein kinase